MSIRASISSTTANEDTSSTTGSSDRAHAQTLSQRVFAVRLIHALHLLGSIAKEIWWCRPMQAPCSRANRPFIRPSAVRGA